MNGCTTHRGDRCEVHPILPLPQVASVDLRMIIKVDGIRLAKLCFTRLWYSADGWSFRGKWPLRPRRSGVFRTLPFSCLRDTNQCRNGPCLAHFVSSMLVMQREKPPSTAHLLPAGSSGVPGRRDGRAQTATPLLWNACPANHSLAKQQTQPFVCRLPTTNRQSRF